MNDKFQSLYKSDLQLQRASVIATALNLIIVFLGVVGIVSLAIFKRTKEIAVRKVLGAGTGRILLLFIKEYECIYIYCKCAGLAACLLYYRQMAANVCLQGGAIIITFCNCRRHYAYSHSFNNSNTML